MQIGELAAAQYFPNGVADLLVIGRSVVARRCGQSPLRTVSAGYSRQSQQKGTIADHRVAGSSIVPDCSIAVESI